MVSGERITLAACVDRQVYRVHSRNLDPHCVFSAADRGFFGIRTKWGTRFIDIEYHVDLGREGFGTAMPLAAVTPAAPPLDPRVRFITHFPTPLCRWCGLVVAWSGPPSPAPWVHLTETTCPDASPQSFENEPLRLFLDAINKEGGTIK